MYHVCYTVFSWFLPANVYLALYFIVFQGFEMNRWTFLDTSGFNHAVLHSAVYGYNLVYVSLLLLLLIIGLGNKPKHLKLTYYFVGTVFGLLMLFSSFIGVAILLSGDALSARSVVLALLTVGVYFIGAALHGEVHHVLLTFSQFTALIPLNTKKHNSPAALKNLVEP